MSFYMWIIWLVPFLVAILAVLYGVATSSKLPSTLKTHQAIIKDLGSEAAFTVMTFNTRWADLNNKEDRGPYSWYQRRKRVAETILSFSPIFVGTQESLMMQNDDLLHLLGGQYTSVGWCKVALLYNNRKLALLDHGEFLLETTPNPRRSEPRRATWAKFRFLDRKFPLATEFLVINTHNDPAIEARRRENIAIIWDRVEALSEKGKIPVFVVGDFNTAPNHFSHRFVTGADGSGEARMTDAWEECGRRAGAGEGCTQNAMTPSYHHFLGAQVNRFDWRLLQYPLFFWHGHGYPALWNRFHVDWILYRNANTSSDASNETKDDVSKPVNLVPRYTAVVVEEEDYGGITASDHFPVVAVFSVARE